MDEAVVTDTCACCIWLTSVCTFVGKKVGRNFSSPPLRGVPPLSRMCPGVPGVEPGVALNKGGRLGVSRVELPGVVAGEGREYLNYVLLSTIVMDDGQNYRSPSHS